MDKSNEKGKTRNRYAKLQPLVNRINACQSSNCVSYYRRAKPYGEHGIDSYAHQLQRDFGNLVLAKSMETKMLQKPMDKTLPNSKMPTFLFDQSILAPATNTATARKHKNHKHRNKERIYCTSLLDLRAELLDILYCILYIMWSPIVFFTRLFLTLASSSASVLYNMAKRSIPWFSNASQEKETIKLEDNQIEILNSLTGKNREEKQPSDLNKFLSKQSSDFNPGGCLISPAVKSGVEIAQNQTEDGKSQQELQSLRKKFNSTLQMVDELCGNLEIEGGNYFQYLSRHQDISSVELSSDCLSDKYSSRFLDYKDCRRRTLRHYQNSSSIAGKKTSLSTLRNSSFKGSRTAVNSKRSHIYSKNSFRKNESRVLAKNVDLSDASEFSDKQPERIGPQKRFHMCRKHTHSKLELEDKGNSPTLLTNSRIKKCEKSGLHTPFPPLPLRPTLQKKASAGDEQGGQEMRNKCTYTLFNDLKNKLIIPESNNSNSLSFQCKPQFSILKNETIVSGSSKDSPDVDEGVRRDKGKDQTEMSEPPSPGGADKDNSSQSEKLSQEFKSEKRKNNSADRPTESMKENLRSAEFTKPIDAKSKWIEMKKKFYGTDYTVAKEQPEKLEPDNLSSITSVSKLPAQKIFQYNMRVGRARQMGEEPPSAEDIFLDRKTTSPCIQALENNAPCSNPSRKEPMYLKSLTPTSRCLSQTQSLSQWPLGRGNSSRIKKHCSPDDKPKPKPRLEGFNCAKIPGDGQIPSTSRGFAQFPHRPTNRTNSSWSSLDVRHNNRALQNGPQQLDWPAQAKNPAAIFSMGNTNSSDDYANKIDSLISFCRTPAAPRKSTSRDSELANQADHKSFDGTAAGDSTLSNEFCH